MTDIPPPDDSEPRAGSLRSLFGLGRKETPDPDAPAATNGAIPHDMRLRITEFEQASVQNVMIPRADIVAVEVETPLPDLLKIFAEESHSRLPVYRDTLDDPVGFVHIKDLVAELARDSAIDTVPLERIRRNVLYVPPSMPLTDLLVKMQSTRIHLALVVDEYGGTDGLVTLEDLVEEIVGEIEDEHDEDAPQFIRRSAAVWEVDSRMEIPDFLEETGTDLSLEDMADEIDTLGGVAYALAGKVPVRGEVLRHPSGADLEIMDSDGRRIRRIRVRLQAQDAPPEE